MSQTLEAMMNRMNEILKRESVDVLLYGTDNQGQSYFIQTCGATDSEGNLQSCHSLGENFSKEEAIHLVHILSQTFKLPMVLAH